MTTGSGSETEPSLLVDAIGRRLRPIGIGALLVVALGAVEFGALARSLSASDREARSLDAYARRLERDQEFAIAEYAPVKASGHDVKLGTFVVNPDGAARARYFRVAVVLTVTDLEQFEISALGKVRASEIIGTTLSARTVEEMGLPGAADETRARLAQLVKRCFMDGLVTDVHFSEFVVQ